MQTTGETNPQINASAKAARPLRIVWVLPRVDLSGGIKSTRLLAEAMQRRGHDAVLAFVEPKDFWPKPWQPVRLAQRLVKAATIDTTRPHHLKQSSATLLPLRGPIIKHGQVPDADVVVATFWRTAEWIADWPDAKGMKTYFIRHHEKVTGKADRIHETYRLPYHKFVIANWLKRVMAEEYGDDGATLVPNGVAWETFDSKPRERGNPPTVGMTYNLRSWKGCDVAFEAIRKAQAKVPGLRAVAFGSDEIRPGMNPPQGMEYHVRPPYDQIASIYRSADAWLIASTSEGFGMPGLEAAASHCPVITTRCGGPEDYVHEDKTGYLVDVGDADTMAQRIVDLVTCTPERWKQMSDASYRTAQDFNWDRSAERFEQRLLALLPKPAEAKA